MIFSCLHTFSVRKSDPHKILSLLTSSFVTCIYYSRSVTNAEVRRRTGCLPLSEIILSRRLSRFRHVARASLELDNRRALYSAVHGQPRDWKRRRGRPAHTWTRTVEADLKTANIGCFSVRSRAQD